MHRYMYIVDMSTTDLGLPGFNLLSDLLQLSEGVVFGGPQDTLEVVDPVTNGNGHLLSLLGCLRTLVEGGMEPG